MISAAFFCWDRYYQIGTFTVFGTSLWSSSLSFWMDHCRANGVLLDGAAGDCTNESMLPGDGACVSPVSCGVFCGFRHFHILIVYTCF